MGEKIITTQVKIDGEIVPDFSFDWEVAFQGEKYIMPLRIPAGLKDNEKLKSQIDLTFQHWAIYQLKRWPFVTIQQIAAGTYMADEEVAPVQLNLKDFCILFGQVLEYYYGDAITIDLNPAWQYKQEATIITISHTKIWNVLIDAFHDKYGVRWEIKAAADNSNTVKGGERYVIRVGYPTTEVDHIFEYGFEGGLLKVERQVQSEEIRNMLKGRGGETNIPFRYFKNTDPNNPDFRPDPDCVEELANIPFKNLMPATFRSYVQGWKAAHISKYPGYTAKGESNAYAPWAYRKGYTDTKFAPVEFVADEITINPATGDRQLEILPGYSPYVKKGSSLAKYGPLPDTLDNNDDIYPTLQGTGFDIAVDVEQVGSDDVAESTENDAQIEDKTYPDIVKRDVAQGHATVADASKRTYFSVPTGKKANIGGYAGVKAYNPKTHEDKSSLIAELDYTIKVFSTMTGEEHSASGIPAGSWYFTVEYSFNNTSPDALNVTLSFNGAKVVSATPSDKWSNTFDIWVKNIWNSSRLGDETDEEYSERVWGPRLGDREKNTAKVVFTSGALVHEGYEFTIVGFPVPDSSKTYEGSQSHWRITLAKSEAELEATGLYVPSTQKQGKAGDTFVFIGTEMTHEPYVVDAEKRLDDWKKDQLGEVKEIKPTFVVTTDRVRLSNEGKPDALINQLRVGNSIRLADKRFIQSMGDRAYETLCLQSITYTYREPTSDDAALNPDVEIVLGNEYTTSANPVTMMQGEISALQRQVGAISNIEQIVRAVGDRLYLRKDGISDRSLSPTQFFSLLTSGNFRAGLVGGAGWGFYKDENGNWVLEADRVNVRQEMSVNTLVINQAEGRGGMEIDTAAYMEVTRVVETNDGYVCYFDQKNGSVANLFHVDDVAFCNRWTPENADLKFYKRRVTAVGADSITLTKALSEAQRPVGWPDSGVNGTGIPAEGDNIIHFGSYTDATRQYVKVRDVVGGGYERYIEALNSVNAAGVEYYFVGKQAGQSRWFVGNKDLVPYSGAGDGSYIEYINRKFTLNNVRLSLGSTIINESTDGDGNTTVVEKPLGDYFSELQQQIDGVIETFNGQGAPTLTNYPANGWTTDEERKRHSRDIYTDITPYVDDATTPTSGQSWRWYYNSPTDYGWTKIADSDAVRALQLARLSVLDNDVLFIQTDSETESPALPTVSPEGAITDLKGWSTTAPEWQRDRYIWQCTYVRRGDGTARFAGPTCLSGINGESVTVTATEVRYSTVHNSAARPADATFTLTDVPALTAGQYLWSRTTVTYSNGDGTVSYGVSRIGADGADGEGVTIASTSVRYARTTTAAQPADSAFTAASIGDLGPIGGGDYIWSRTTVTYSDGTPVSSYGVSRIGSDGDAAVAGLHIAYASGITGSLPHPTAVTGFSVTMFSGARYIGVYTDDKEADSTDFNDYEWALFKGEDGRGIASIEEQYYLSDSQTQLTGGSWKGASEKPTWVPGKYMWTRTKTTLTDGTVIYTDAVCVTGTPGTSVLAEYSADAVSWHPTFTATDVWMRTSDDGGSTWSTAMRIVGSDGADGPWRKFQWALGTTTAATGAWSDTPVTAKPGEYVWMRSGMVVPPATSPATWEAAIRLTGDKGSDGQSVYMLDIDNEVSGIACDASGTVTGSYPTPQASVYKGSTKLTGGITYSIAQKTGITTASITAAGAVTMNGMTADRATVTVQAKVDGVTLTSVISLYKVKAGASGQAAVVYSIEASADSVTRSMTGALSASSVTCTVYKTTGNSARTATNDHTLTYRRLPDGATGTLGRTGGTSSAVQVLDTTQAIIFELRNASGDLLDRERVPVLSDASDLEIGGRNLLRRSGVPVTTSSYLIVSYDTTEALEAGARYTCTLWGELGSGKERFGLYVNGGNNNFMPELKKVGDGVYRATVEAPAMADGRKMVSLFHLPSSVTATSTVRKIKLERGTTGTDWTPAPEDVEEEIGSFDYLKAALAQDGAIEGGLALMSHIKVGMNTDASALTQTTYAGLNGLIPDNIAYVGSVIAAWFGGDMEDLFTYNASTKRYSLISNPSSSKRYAAALFRMDGSLYAAKGNLFVQPDGFTQWGKGSTAVTISPEGVVSLGNGIKIDLSSGAQGLAETMESVLNTQNALTELLEPINANGEHMSWAEAAKKDSTGAYKAKGLRAKVSLYTERSLAAYYTGGSVTGGGSGGSGGLNESQLAAYLQQHGYLRSADLSGYLTKVAAEATYQPKGNYLTEDQLDHIKVINCYKTTEWNDFRVSGATALTLRAFDVYEATGAPSTYGNILEIAGRSNHWQPQLWFDSGATGSIRHRNKAYNSNAWGQWHTLLDSNNYPSVLDGRYVTRGTAQEITAAKTFKAAVTLDGASLLLKHPNTTGGTARTIYFQDYDDTTAFGFGSMLGNHVALHAYIGWGDSPWDESTNFAVSADKLRYKGNDILHAGNYAAKLDGRYVTKDSDQTIGGSKTFTYGYIKAETLLMFKDKSVSDGIYIAPKPDGGVAFSAHTNYGWTANIGSISHAGDLTMKSFIKTGGTSSQFLKADGSVDGTPYATVASVTALTNSLAAFVKKAGDTMSGYLYIAMNGRTTRFGSENSAFSHYITDATNGHWFNRPVYVSGDIYAGSGYNQKVWHAGNDGSGSGLDADLLDGWHRDDIRKGVLCFQRFSGTQTAGGVDLNTLAPDGGAISNYGETTYWANAPQGATYGVALKFSWADTNLGGMLFADINHNSATDVTRSLWWRASGTVNGAKAWGGWHQIAFTDGNVASATKLADNTAFKAWGQVFFQNGKPQPVSGNLTDVGSITSGYYYLNNSSTNPYLRLTLNSRNWYVQAFTDKLFVGAGIANSLQIAPDGSVGIGLASSATPAYKLDVNGPARVSSLLTATSGIQIGSTADIGWYIASGTRIAAGAGTARGVNVGSLLVSNAWADHTKVPANGIFSKGTVRVGDGTGTVTGLYSSVVSLHAKGATAGVLLESSDGAAWNTMMYSDGMPRWGYRASDGAWNQVLGYLPSDNSFRFTADIGVAAGQRILFRTSKNAVYELYYDETENALVFTGNLVTEKSMAAFRK